MTSLGLTGTLSEKNCEILCFYKATWLSRIYHALCRRLEHAPKVISCDFNDFNDLQEHSEILQSQWLCNYSKTPGLCIDKVCWGFSIESVTTDTWVTVYMVQSWRMHCNVAGMSPVIPQHKNSITDKFMVKSQQFCFGERQLLRSYIIALEIVLYTKSITTWKPKEETLKADSPPLRNYLHKPTDYRHTDKLLRLVMNKQTNRQMDGLWWGKTRIPM